MRILLDVVFPPRTSERTVRMLSEAELGERISPLIPEHSPDVVSLFRYRDPVIESVIVEAKFHNNKKAQQMLATMLGDYLSDWRTDRFQSDDEELVLVPMPLSARRMKERGYNQVERILLHLPHNARVQRLLKRARDTRPQTSLPKNERLSNMADAFAAIEPLNPDTIYVVIDDVITTGATMRAAISALHKAGGSQIYGIALAH